MFSTFKKNEVLKKTLTEFINRKLNLPNSPEYAYTVVNKKKPSEILIISNYPDQWINLYYQNSFQLIDPVILNAFKRSSPFTWDENITLISDLKFTRIFSLSRKYNILNGCTFVLHDHFNNLSLLSIIISNNEQKELEKFLSCQRNELQMLLIDINEKMYNLAKSNHHDIQKNQNNKTLFSPRENEVLYWASMGKTYSEIAIIAGISISTVKFHMKSAVIKLGVNNARQAIRIGIELDLIIPATTLAT